MAADEVAGPLEHALANEIMAEIARQRRHSKAIYQAIGLSSAAWQSYLKARSRHLPLPVLISICAELGVRPSEMLRRAEDGPHRFPR